MITAKIADKYSNTAKQIITHEDEFLGLEANLAVKILGTLALATGEPDGEDAAERQKLRLLSVEEVAQRACDLSRAMFVQFRERGWVVKGPSAEEYFNDDAK